MARGLDHIVHAVRDLDAAAELYRRLGFTVGSRNRHPPEWGTENHIVQLPGVYLELLGLGDTTRTVPHGARHFSFGAFNRDFLARGEGLSMLALEERGAPDAEAFRAAGIGDFEPFELAREARRPDGTTVRLAFTLTFARDPNAPNLGAFAIRHHFPEHFWNPAVQIHANTAIAGVVLVADNPRDHHIFLSALAGERELLATSAGIALKTPRGEIQVFTPAAFRDHFGTSPPGTAEGARLAAVRFAVRDRDALLAALEAGNVRSSQSMGRVVVGPEVALGATLAWQLSVDPAMAARHVPAEGTLMTADLMPNAIVEVGRARFGNTLPLSLIAGPCALESRAHALEMAHALKEIAARLKIGLVYKTSFDKANRTSAKSARGLGLDEALPIFADIRDTVGVPVLTDVHEIEQCARAAQAVDVLQIPAFLCRQTDLLVAAAETGKVVNVKKGQFLAPWDMKNVVAKLTGAGCRNVLVTERGASFGYNTLVSDMRALPILARDTGAPVIFDATHSVQQPGGQGTSSGGEREFVPVLSRAAVAVGVAGVFIETHQDPDRAPSDGPNMVRLKDMEGLLRRLMEFDRVAKSSS